MLKGTAQTSIPSNGDADGIREVLKIPSNQFRDRFMTRARGSPPRKETAMTTEKSHVKD